MDQWSSVKSQADKMSPIQTPRKHFEGSLKLNNKEFNPK